MEQKETERKSLSKQGRKEKDRSIRGMGGDETGQGKGKGIIQIRVSSKSVYCRHLKANPQILQHFNFKILW